MNDTGKSDRAFARHRAVAQIAEDLQTLVVMFRERGLAHPKLPEQRQQLHTQLFIYLQIHDMLAIDLVDGALSFEGQPLPHAEHLAQPLYRVGVRQLVLESGLEPGELIALTNAWTRAVQAPGTDFVEDLEGFDLDHIWLMIAGPDSSSSPLGDEVEIDESPDEIELDDVSSLTHEVEGASTTSQAREGSWPGALSAEDAAHLRDAIASDDAAAIRTALVTLMMAAGPASDDQRLRVARLIKQGFVTLAQRGRFDLLLIAYQVSVPGEAFDPRAQLLADGELLLPALDALERFPSDELSLLLAMAPAEAGSLIFERALRQPRGPVREVMKHLLMSIPIQGEVLADGLRFADDDLGELFVQLAVRNPEGIPQRFWQGALEHPHAAVRSSTLSRMAHDHYDGLCELIYPLLADPDRNIRRAALDLIMRRHDTRAAPFLAVRMEAKEIANEELHSVVVALGRLGTADASRGLREQLDVRREAKIKAAILLALTQVEGEGAREVLQQHAEKRFFSNRQVRDAADEGLRRLDAKLAGRRFTPWDGDLPSPPSSIPPASAHPRAPQSVAATPEAALPPSQMPSSLSASARLPAPPAVPTPEPLGTELELELEEPLRRQSETEPGVAAGGDYAPRRARTEDAPKARSLRPQRRQVTSKPASARRSDVPKRDTTHRTTSRPPMTAIDDNTIDRVDMRRLRRLSSHRQLEAASAPPPQKRGSSPTGGDGPAFARTVRRLLAGGAVDEALAVLEEAKQDHSAHPELFALLATVHEQRDDLSKAVDALHEAVLLAPDRNDLAERLYDLREREVGQR